jgi:hypothetical protein
MAIVFDSLSLRGLRKTHLEQLEWYVFRARKAGIFYGNKKQFDKRHKELEVWIKDAVDYANSSGVVMPRGE